jgi:NAD(P)-dependent dehydrogenase (short-subunit alcohol dehydrogenase family)
MEENKSVLKNILITGGTSGLGLELVKLLLAEDCELYVTGRDPDKLPLHEGNLHFIPVDLSDLDAVKAVINDLKVSSIRLDLIVNNAGILSPPGYTNTKDGLEYTFQVNFLSQLLLDDLIIRRTTDNADLTIVAVTSPVYQYIKPDFRMSDKEGYRAYEAYAKSKFFILLFGDYFRNKYPEKRLKFYGFNPGTFSSGIYRMQKKWFQILYQIAVPFMRSPVKVANALYKILLNQETRDGVIYDTNSGIKSLPFSEPASVKELFEDCEQKLARFLT